MSRKTDKTLSDFFHSCSEKSTALYQDFIYILTEKQKKNHALLVSGQESLSEVDQELLDLWIRKKSEDYPIQYFINSVEFCGLDFHIEEGALIPRMETEEIVKFALDKVKNEKIIVKSLLDIGSGSGCMGIAASKLLGDDDIETVLLEPSDEALKSLKVNADKFRPSRLKIVKEDFETADFGKTFDLILSNPPYIKPGDEDVHNSVYTYEPHKALYGGDDPVKLIVFWANKAYDLLNNKGLMVFEFSHDQKLELENRLRHLKPKFYKDSFGKDRYFSVMKMGN